MIELGSNVKDLITGAIGIAVARNEFINGCVRYTIQRPVDKDGKIPDEIWVDEKQIEVIGTRLVKIKSEATGGPVGYKIPKY